MIFPTLPNQTGIAHITVTVKDDGGTGNGGRDTITQTFQVTVTNQVPVANNQSVSARPGKSKSIVLTAADPDGDALTYQIVTFPNPASGSLNRDE